MSLELEDEGMICISLHLVDFYAINVGKYTNPMDTMGYQLPETSELEHFRILQQKKLRVLFSIPRDPIIETEHGNGA